MNEWDDESVSEEKNYFNVCSLTGSGTQTDLKQAEKLAENSQFVCLTCKGASKDPKRLCSPAFK